MTWTYTSDSCGYMLYKDGNPVEGARTLGTRTHTSDGRRRARQNVRKDIAMHRDTAKRICEERNRLCPA